MYQPLKRHGGKAYLADWILNHAPSDYTTYCEPYFGGGAVLLKHPVGRAEVVNDLDGNLSNFWKVLADTELFERFARAVEATPFSQDRWREAAENLEGDCSQSNLDRAVDFFVLSRMSRQGLCKDFATMSKSRTRRGMNEQASQWLGAVEGLPEIHERLRGVVILNEDAVRVIKSMDHLETWFYLDPPYVQETRTAKNAYRDMEVSTDHHVVLLETLAQLRGKFALSGYRCDLYDEVAEACGWRRVEKQIDNKASSAATKPVMTECLWMNYE